MRLNSPAKSVYSQPPKAKVVSYDGTNFTQAQPLAENQRKPSVQHIFDMARLGRPRLAGHITMSNGRRSIIQFISAGERVQGIFTSTQLGEMGFTILDHNEWLELISDDDVIIVTQWPLEDGYRASNAQLQRTRTIAKSSPSETAIVSEGSEQTATTGSNTSEPMPSYGQFR